MSPSGIVKRTIPATSASVGRESAFNHQFSHFCTTLDLNTLCKCSLLNFAFSLQFFRVVLGYAANCRLPTTIFYLNLQLRVMLTSIKVLYTLAICKAHVNTLPQKCHRYVVLPRPREKTSSEENMLILCSLEVLDGQPQTRMMKMVVLRD